VFDLRYHVASLAAVFIALIIGILVGVGISGSGFVEASERNVLNERINELRRDNDRGDERIEELEAAQRSAQAFVDRVYPVVMEDRLLGRSIAVLYVGGVDPGVAGSVERALDDAGAIAPLRVRALKVPITVETLETRLAAQPALLGYAGEENLERLARALADEFVDGRETPLWRALSNELVTQQNGPGHGGADGVVIVRSAGPQSDETARFVIGLYSGLADAGVPVVAVETLAARPSAVPVYRRIPELSSVDAVDTAPGRLALVLLLQGARTGHYGLKTTATDGVLPPVEPLLLASADAGG
jgi:hypothetical protein